MKNLLIAAILLFTLASCKKEITELPEASQSGSNTFGAKINGDLWGPADNAVISTAAKLEGRLVPDGVFINARNFASSPNETEMEIYVKGTTPGVYPLNSNTNIYPNHSASYAYFVKRNLTPQNEWITSSQYTGQVTITRFDVANHIVSGTFSFTAGEITNSGSPLTVTEGRFDVKVQ